jgi:hypothetical protein
MFPDRRTAMGVLDRIKPGKKAGSDDNEYLGLRIFVGGTVVAIALIALVYSLHLVLDNYDGKAAVPAPTKTNVPTKNAPKTEPVAVVAETPSVSASSVVAVLSPVVAGIVGIAGLFFGISATGSARGTEAETKRHVAAATEQFVAATIKEKQADQPDGDDNDTKVASNT